jgi:hypothetical protein
VLSKALLSEGKLGELDLHNDYSVNFIASGGYQEEQNLFWENFDKRILEHYKGMGV